MDWGRRKRVTRWLWLAFVRAAFTRDVIWFILVRSQEIETKVGPRNLQFVSSHFELGAV